ncbi:MAG: hypothetical protein NC312_09030 [Bacteroides fragilis]|nr:hypothetical protein [Bacteroides fragilis]
MPEQIFPLLKHIFGKKYPKDTPVELLAAEYSAPGKSNPHNLSAIFADIVLRIAGSDIYHLECQMEKDEYLSFRMFEYDAHIALLYGLSRRNQINIGPDMDSCIKESADILRFPSSVILHLDTNGTVPEKSACRLILSDTAKSLYSVTIVRVQNYSLQQIRENHLTLFLPFTLLRFRPRLDTKSNPVTKKELTVFVNEIIIILKDELSENHITRRQYKDYINYIRLAADHILLPKPELHKEVTEMLTTIIPSYSEMEDQITERVTAMVTDEVTAKVTAKVTDEVTAKVTGEVTAKVTDEVTAKVTAEVTAEVTARVTSEMTTKFQKKLQDETSRLTLKLQKKDSQLSAANSENLKLRALLRTHGIDINGV